MKIEQVCKSLYSKHGRVISLIRMILIEIQLLFTIITLQIYLYLFRRMREVTTIQVLLVDQTQPTPAEAGKLICYLLLCTLIDETIKQSL